MRIFANFTPVIKIILWILFGVSVAVLVASVLVVCDAVVLRFLAKGQAYVLLFTSSLSLVVTLALGTAHYKLTSTHLRLNVAFFDVLSGRIRLENVLNILIRDKKMYISYVWQGPDPVIAQIAISPKRFEKMKDALLKANERIVFFDEDADKKKEYKS